MIIPNDTTETQSHARSQTQSQTNLRSCLPAPYQCPNAARLTDLLFKGHMYLINCELIVFTEALPPMQVVNKHL